MQTEAEMLLEAKRAVGIEMPDAVPVGRPPEAFGNNADSNAVAWRDVQYRCRINDLSVSPALAAKIADHNAAVAKALRVVDDAFAAVQSAVADAESGSRANVGDLMAVAEKSRIDRAAALELLVETWRQREQLTTEARAELESLIAPAEKALSRAKAEARKKLAEIGCSREALLAVQPKLNIPDDFIDSVVDYRVASVVKARNDLKTAVANRDGAFAQVIASKNGQAEAQKIVAKMVRRMAAI